MSNKNIEKIVNINKLINIIKLKKYKMSSVDLIR